MSRLVQHHNTKHGMSHTKLYKAWQLMINRCHNPKAKDYKDYGGRGIKVCTRWHKFENFYADMGERPEGAQLDRKDNGGNYCKSNCRWSTRKEQQSNRRDTLFITYRGKTKSSTQWAEELGFHPRLIRRRILDFKWPIEKALTTKAQRNV